jgi:hypothetical protein
MQVFKEIADKQNISLATNGVITFSFMVMLWVISGCMKDSQHTVYDNVIYEVNPVAVYASNADKTKQKSPEQFVSILYTNLTNKTIPGDELNNLSELMMSMGDKGLTNQMLLENFLMSTDISIPSDAEMRRNTDEFVKATYLKFFLRNPTEYEKYYFKDLISKDVTITPEMIYAAFAQSNEYLFY